MSALYKFMIVAFARDGSYIISEVIDRELFRPALFESQQI
jgi:hypothetical protein